jgi:hypothetical protein
MGEPARNAGIGDVNVTARITPAAARTRVAFGIAAFRPKGAWNVGEKGAYAAGCALV